MHRTHPLFRVWLTALLIASLGSAEYAVAPAPQGDDGGSGRDRPFATLGKALSRASSGDTILMARGGVFRETPGSVPAGVTIKAGGDASRPPPMLTPALPVTGWKPWDKNAKVLVTSLDRPVYDLYVDGRFMVLARYPDLGKGWMRTASGTSPETIVSPDRAKAPKAAANRWTGGQARWRRWSWWWETRPITGDDGSGRLTLGAEGRFQDPFTGEGSGFYVDNLLSELDAPGEWFYDAAAKNLYLMPPTDADPKAMLVEAVTSKESWKLSGGTLDGIGFARFADQALQIGRPSTVMNCLFQDISTDAIRGTFDAAGTKVTGCTFRDVRNIAISWIENANGPGGTVFEGNRLERIGMLFGYGGSGSWKASGMVIFNGKEVTIRRNTIIDTGYAGVILGSPGQVIERNIFVRCMGSLNDGAAIYANTSKLRIHENIVLDTVGNLDTSHFWYPLGHGIWMEFLSQFRDHSIVGNTVFGSGGNGLYMPNNFNCTISENVMVGNRLGQIALRSHDGIRTPQGHTMVGNVLVAQSPSRRLQFHQQIPGNWSGNDAPSGLATEAGIDFGRMSDTVYILSPGVAAMRADKRSYTEPGSWKAEMPWADQNPRQARLASLLLINDTDTEQTMSAPGSGWLTSDGKALGKGVLVKPFRSAVVVRPGSEAGLPPYLCASGIDWRAEPRAADQPEPKAKGRKPTAKVPVKPAVPEETAKPPPVATPKPLAASWTTWVERLRERTGEALKQGKRPGFVYADLRQEVTIDAIDGESVTLITQGAGTINVTLFTKLKPADGYALAKDLARSGSPADHALAAFFATCAGLTQARDEHLRQAGPSSAAEIAASFPAVQ
ncbi:MAG TPA: hypothetical protein DCS97_10865 [Planctomycetes bacterium]|nr:hypothetical protein [Planctomycetota bacterium]